MGILREKIGGKKDLNFELKRENERK